MNTLSQILSEANESPIPYRFGCQIQSCLPRTTKSQKPYYELKVVDAKEAVALKVWNNHPQFDHAMSLKTGQFLAIEGQFTKNQYGLDSPDWKWEPLQEHEKDVLLAGDPELISKQKEDWDSILSDIGGIEDPRLRALCSRFISEYGEKFKRAAAAKKNHHARRGGLVEHVAYMMKSAVALSQVYTYINKDLVVTAVLFHDCGKLWENNYPEEDFHQAHSFHAEALGHICLGIELVNKIWRDLLSGDEAAAWKELHPPSEKVRIHLLHLIASHHGTLEFGSPLVPKTPEAHLLHYVDNLDAKLEMCGMAYNKSAKLSPVLYEKMFPLPGNLLEPLEKFQLV